MTHAACAATQRHGTPAVGLFSSSAGGGVRRCMGMACKHDASDRAANAALQITGGRSGGADAV